MRNTWFKTHSSNLYTVSSGAILFYFCHIFAVSTSVLCRYIQAIRQLKAEGRKLMRTVHLMFVPGKICDCFPYSSLICNLNTKLIYPHRHAVNKWYFVYLGSVTSSHYLMMSRVSSKCSNMFEVLRLKSGGVSSPHTLSIQVCTPSHNNRFLRQLATPTVLN